LLVGDTTRNSLKDGTATVLASNRIHASASGRLGDDHQLARRRFDHEPERNASPLRLNAEDMECDGSEQARALRWSFARNRQEGHHRRPAATRRSCSSCERWYLVFQSGAGPQVKGNAHGPQSDPSAAESFSSGRASRLQFPCSTGRTQPIAECGSRSGGPP